MLTRKPCTKKSLQLERERERLTRRNAAPSGSGGGGALPIMDHTGRFKFAAKNNTSVIFNVLAVY